MTEEANTFAWIVLFGWPVFAVYFFAMRRRTARLARTTAWAMILPVMFLPSALEFDPPLIPLLDKHRLSFLAIALSLRLFHRKELADREPGHRFPDLVLAVMVFGTFATSRTNSDDLVYGDVVLPSYKPYDAFASSVALWFDDYLPFIVGQRVFRTERDLRDLFEVLTIAAFIYLPFCLVELRMSPQFHNWVYGYFPSAFDQAVRGGGYRPVVFMNHGLCVALFAFCTLASGLALRRAKVALPSPSAGARVALSSVLLLLTKSFGSISYGLSTVVAQLVLSPRAIARCVLAACCLMVVYPLSRASNVFPAHELAHAIASINPERAASLDYRFVNEDALLARAQERPLFGWGGFGRNRIYDDEGKDVSVTDGYWIMMLGAFGYVGFGAFFGLFIVPLVRYVRARAELRHTDQILLGSLALMLALLLIDQIPNARSDLLPMAYAGALYTLSERLRTSHARAEPARVRSTVRQRVYA